jgi:hemoglobin
MRILPLSPAVLLIGIVALTTAIAARPSSALQSVERAVPASGQPTLYERLGGYDFIARLVDTAFPRVASHPDLNRLFRGHSKDSQMRQRQLIVDVLCRETGGPCFYTGRPLPAVHEGLGITDDDWMTFMGVIGSALDDLDVPQRERTELLDLFEERLRATVVLDGV